jgi:hypothetical protein
MDIVILNNGFGLMKPETLSIKRGGIELKFLNAPSDGVVTFVTDTSRMARHLDENGAYILDLSTLSGNIKILMTGAGKVWNCGSINVSRDEDGAVIVSTLTDYVDQITRCVEKIESIERSITYINEVIRELRKKLDLDDKQYKLI